MPFLRKQSPPSTVEAKNAKHTSVPYATNETQQHILYQMPVTQRSRAGAESGPQRPNCLELAVLVVQAGGLTQQGTWGSSLGQIWAQFVVIPGCVASEPGSLSS